MHFVKENDQIRERVRKTMGSVTTDPAKMDAVFNGGRFGTAEKQKKKDADEKLWVTELQG